MIKSELLECCVERLDMYIHRIYPDIHNKEEDQIQAAIKKTRAVIKTMVRKVSALTYCGNLPRILAVHLHWPALDAILNGGEQNCSHSQTTVLFSKSEVM